MQDKTVHLFRASTLCDETRPSDTIEHAKTTWSDLSDETLSEKWLIDSGASCIMPSHCHWFCQFSPLPKPIKVILGNNSSIPATGQGHILVHMNTSDGHRNAILQDILYVRDLSRNLLSISHFACQGTEMHFVGEGCQILDQHKEITCIGYLQGNLYTMDIKVLTAESVTALSDNIDSSSLRRKLYRFRDERMPL